MKLEPGAVVFGRYRLDAEVGAGGMGVVWRATDELLDQRVALKRVSFAHRGVEQAGRTRERTMREARLAAQLRGHPHVVAIYDVLLGEDDVWLVLEYLPSQSLADVLRSRGPLDPAEAALIGAGVADALAAGHAQGIVHRDVKPGNVLLGEDGIVKLTDFGISNLEGEPSITETGTISGTIPYMAPEVASNGTSTPASDIFSLGSTLYEAVEGQPPFGQDENSWRLLGVVRNGIIRPPATDGPLSPLLLRLLQLDPATRLDAGTARDQLAQIAQRRTAPTDPEPTGDRAGHTSPLPPDGENSEPTGEPVGRRPRRLAIALWVAALLLGVAGSIALALEPAISVDGHPVAPDLTGVPPIPDSVPPVMLTGDPRAADPCALVELPWLGQFGQPRFTVSYLIENCQVRIATPEDGEIYLDVFFEDPVYSVSDLEGEAQRLGALTLVRQPAVPDDGLTVCRHTLVLADNTTIIVDSSSYDSDTVDLCGVTEVASANAVTALARRGITYSPDRVADYAIAASDACTTLDHAALAAVPGLDPNIVLPGFANWACSWGVRTEDSPQVDVAFRLDDTSRDNGTPTTIAGKSAQLAVEEGWANEQQCTAWVLYRRPTTATSAIEMFTVIVDAALPADQLCSRASDLAANAVAHLPPA